MLEASQEGWPAAKDPLGDPGEFLWRRDGPCQTTGSRFGQCLLRGLDGRLWQRGGSLGGPLGVVQAEQEAWKGSIAIGRHDLAAFVVPVTGIGTPGNFTAARPSQSLKSLPTTRHSS